MRILRIKFENLNSLACGDIDLEQGPLADAGIFAITGPTGAGKSTLLDAITLALYGRAARYDKEPNPENMMSRHTGSCRAEVLFEVPKGRFQARWELRRARGKADGKLQAAKRTVVQDGCGTVLAEKIDDADRLIEELTGLDYERFRRSVLLAQGEFTRFLKAKPDERAELLESLTGTSIYSELSELAYREATLREESLNSRLETLRRVVLLSEEDRAAKRAEIDRITEEIEQMVRRRGLLAEGIERGRNLLARLKEQAEIAQKQADLSVKTTAAAPQMERLKAHRLAQPFLAPLQTLDALDRRFAEAQAKTREAQALATEALVRLASGLQAANAVSSGLLQHSQEACDKQEAGINTTFEELSKSEVAERDAAALVEKATATFAGLLKGRTEESMTGEFAKIEQKRSALVALRTAMEKRDSAAAEASRLADEEAGLVEEVEAASQEKAMTLQEEEAQAALLESARANLLSQARIVGLDEQRTQLESGQPCPLCGALDHPYLHPDTLPTAALEEARRNLNAAKTASDTAAREAKIAANGLTRTEERLAGVRKRRGEIRWQQTADHETFEKMARSARVFTSEALAEALEALEKDRVAHEVLAKKLRDCEAARHAADKTFLTCRGLVAQLREKHLGQKNTFAESLRQRDALLRETQKLAAMQSADDLADTKIDTGLAAGFRTQWTPLDEVSAALETLRYARAETAATAEERRNDLDGVQKAVAIQAAELKKQLEGSVFPDAASLRAVRLDAAETTQIETLLGTLQASAQTLQGQFSHVQEQVCALRGASAPEGEALTALEAERQSLETQLATATEARTTHRNDLARDDQTRSAQAEQLAQLEAERGRLAVWDRLRRLIGSASGAAFRQFAQGLSLDLLVRHANRHLARLSERYRLRRVETGELTLEIVDRHQADATRPMQSLSGGESFLASLALALGLSDLAGRNVRIDSLFIDEGFGSLDAATLDLAVAALDSLRLTNKTVGVISHVELLKERIPVQIRIEKRTGGMSILHVPQAA